jgi:hypothetical protein
MTTDGVDHAETDGRERIVRDAQRRRTGAPLSVTDSAEGATMLAADRGADFEGE